MAAYTKKTINRIQEGSSSSPVTWNSVLDQVEENFDDVQTGVNAHVDDQSNPHNVTSTQIPYSNIDSGLDSETVKEAIDELDFKFGQGATNLPTPDTLVKRDLEGRARVEDPSHDLDIANKQFTLSAGMTQVWQTLKTDTAETSSSTWQAIPGLSITLTPEDVDDAFDVQYICHGRSDVVSDAEAAPVFRLVRNGVVLTEGDASAGTIQVHSGFGGGYSKPRTPKIYNR